MVRVIARGYQGVVGWYGERGYVGGVGKSQQSLTATSSEENGAGAKGGRMDILFRDAISKVKGPGQLNMRQKLQCRQELSAPPLHIIIIRMTPHHSLSSSCQQERRGWNPASDPPSSILLWSRPQGRTAGYIPCCD
ncbi:hypothetical protein Tco_1162588 [Tanacetum coccineum]